MFWICLKHFVIKKDELNINKKNTFVLFPLGSKSGVQVLHKHRCGRWGERGGLTSWYQEGVTLGVTKGPLINLLKTFCVLLVQSLGLGFGDVYLPSHLERA